MKEAQSKKKKDYLNLIVKLILLTFFILAIIRGYIDTTLELSQNYGFDYTVSDFIELTKRRVYLRPALLLLIPIIGIFFNNKFGWILICSYLYFVLTRLIYTNMSEGFYDSNAILFFIIILALILSLLWIMNRKKTSKSTYNIPKNELWITNIKATAIGIFLTILIA